MKIAALLTQYLYQNKQLEIPGIGRFRLPESAILPETGEKGMDEFVKLIEFSPKPVLRPTDELIDFIRSKTGKIKPLAESDLDSFLADCKSILNIGKPFYIEGIGTLQKNKDGRIDFMHGQAASERLEVSHSSEKPNERQKDNKPLYNTEYTSQNSQANNLRKMLIIGGILVGLAVIVWGGYLLYSKNTESREQVEQGQVSTPQTNNIDTVQTMIDSSLVPKSDSVSRIPESLVQKPTPVVSSGSYKFICEVTQTKARAIQRYATLQQLNRNFQMETTDSIHFSIYVVLPATDTTRQKDSLKLWYWGARDRQVQIDHSR